jgi:hypothetical protein
VRKQKVFLVGANEKDQKGAKIKRNKCQKDDLFDIFFCFWESNKNDFFLNFQDNELQK